jgi:hypothetical protein
VVGIRRRLELRHRQDRELRRHGDDLRRLRRTPRALQVVGALGCLVLVATLPVLASAVGAGVVVLGVGYRILRLRLGRA